jgi:hypothetical protein
MKPREEAPWLASGFLLMIFSGFGQTYYIALFAGHIKSELVLTDGLVGLLLDAGVQLEMQLLVMAVYSFAAVFWVVYLIPRMDRLVNGIS